ncbi:rhodanese-related sulfurtransferase [Chitinophaga sp.]|uniref:oxygen-dependent tRNA uridine(34) hydroxylase TrhO n=1 Tax=Chitinophaga sp. TaxID=1869181 RepID=UPI0031DBF7F6
MVLHNRLSATELKRQLAAETFFRVTVSFYQYAKIADPQAFRDSLYISLSSLGVFGRIYVAHEGINAQVSIPEHHFEAFKQQLYAIPFLNGIRLNIAVDDNGKSFWVLKIKVREKIVADGITDPTFDMEKRGRYVDAAAFNQLAEDPDTVIIDMRNHYEYEVGHFDKALEVPSATFREQLPMAVEMMQPHKDKNIIMYCTGGIRCEKASAYMLHQGFKNVFHLEGGIIEYTNKARELGLPNKFRGKNFVFDDRLGERISEDIISQCHQCGEPCDTHTNCANEGCHLLFIQCEKCAAKYKGCCSDACTEVLALPEEQQAELRKGIDKGLMLFNKRRRRTT